MTEEEAVNRGEQHYSCGSELKMSEWEGVEALCKDTFWVCSISNFKVFTRV